MNIDLKKCFMKAQIVIQDNENVAIRPDTYSPRAILFLHEDGVKRQSAQKQSQKCVLTGVFEVLMQVADILAADLLHDLQ